MYETIKKFLAEGGKCLLIEDGKPIGVVLTMEEYEKIKEIKKESPELLMSDINTSDKKENPIPTLRSEIEGRDPDRNSDVTSERSVGIGAAMVEEMGFPPASASIDEINLADVTDVTLEDLGLDEISLIN